MSRPDLRRLAGDLAVAIEGATLALVRVDERLGRSDPELAEGVRARAHLMEAQALAQLSGELVPLEALILHDAGMDARVPGAGTVRAARLLAQRRALAARAPETVLAAEAIRRLAGLAVEGGGPAEAPDIAPDGPDRAGASGQAEPRPGGAGARPRELDLPDDDRVIDDPFADALGDSDGPTLDLEAIDRLLARTREPLALRPRGEGPAEGPPAVRLRDPGYGAEARFDHYREALDASRDAPGALAAALALDAWLTLEPAERGGEAGWALAATVLRQRGLCDHHLPALAFAYRKGRFRWSPHLGLERRLEGLLAAIAGSARLTRSDLQRLTLARELMMRRCEGRRAGSRLPELVGLFLKLPLVTTQLAAQRLSVTPQAIEAMLKELGPALPRELTGRKRYRAWGIVPDSP